ncbi:uncharacterized protein [Engystomops pustulosus]|uniref:uncharacterized protein isoform X2 n=1 Tax=Engystomops pustulosus TaxID=76066 RepID=UPI003AFA4A15
MIHLARRVEMKAICPLLVIAAVWCIAPALSSVIREGKEEQDTNEGPSCLQNVVANSGNARGSVIKFLCAYLQFKDLPDKTEFVQAIRLLEDGTQCKTEDIFGRSQSPEQVAMDENGVLTNQIQSMKQILEQSGVSLISVEAVCVLMETKNHYPHAIRIKIPVRNVPHPYLV